MIANYRRLCVSRISFYPTRGESRLNSTKTTTEDFVKLPISCVSVTINRM